MTVQPAPVAAPPATGNGPRRPRPWIVVLVVGWCAALAVAIGWAVVNGGPTAREQTTVAQARTVVDRAAAQVATAASLDGQAVVAISGFNRVEECAITVVRPGMRYQRTVTAVVTPGTESALLERVAQRLPAEYETVVNTGVVPRLFADAGFWVRLTGSTNVPGQVRFIADTGDCRPLGDPAVVNEPGGPEGDRSAIAPLLGRLGVPAQQWNTYRAPCPGGGYLSTVEAIGPEEAIPGALDEVLLGAAKPVVATAELYGFLSGTTGIAVRAGDNRIVVTATTGCPTQ